MVKSDELSIKINALNEEMVQAIREALADNGYVIESETMGFDEDDEFEDEANNTIVGVSQQNVYFKDNSGDVECYPLHELGFYDGVQILTILE